MKFSYKPLSIIVLAALPGIAYADHIEHPLVLPAVDVTAKRDELGASMTQPDMQRATTEINKTAGGVTIVDAEKYREGRVSNFNDTLGLAPGVFIQSRFGSEESRISIRGSGLQRNFHGLGIRLMQDGIPVNLADGSFDFPAIDPLATRYVEVYRGANALQYGASNLGGAINFVSPTGYDTPRLEVRTEAGSYGYYRLGMTTGGVIDQLDYFLAASTYGQNGFRDDANQSAQRFNGNVGYRINDNAETRFYFGYTGNDSDLPEKLTKQQMRDNPRQSQYEANPGDPILTGTGQWKRDIDLWRVANKTTLRFDQTILELGAFYSRKDLFHPIVDLAYLSFLPFPPFSTGTFATLGVIDQQTDDFGLTARLTRKGELFGLNNEVVAGFSPTYGETDDKRYRNLNGHRGALTNRFAQTASNIEMFVEDRLSLTQDLTFIPGMQYTHSKRESDDKFINPATGDESYDQTYSQTSPKLGLLYQASPQVQFFANVSRSFAPPDFGDLIDPATAKTLEAQKATTFEVGTRGNSSNIDWDIAIYYARLQDELLGVSSTPGVTDTINAGRTIHAGLEMGMTARLPMHLEWRQNLLINDFRLDNDPTFGDNRIPGIQRSLLRGELLYRNGGFYMGPTIETSPQRYAVDFAETLYADSYTIFGWKMGQQYNEHWSWFLEGRNLTDRTYAATTDVLKVFDPSADRPFFPGDGASVYTGMQWRY